jgi:predicted O-linked N-acetylglucosamine transferase (SPINDLY family)
MIKTQFPDLFLFPAKFYSKHLGTICFLLLGISVSAQNISEEKQAVLNKLSNIMIIDKVVIKQKKELIETIQKQINSNNEKLMMDLRYSIDDLQLQDNFTKEFSRLNEKMQKKFADLFDEKIDFKQILSNMNAEIYNKHFTTEELIIIGRFFASKPGRKYLELGPEIIREAEKMSSESLTLKTGELINELSNEYMESFRELRDYYDKMEKKDKK